MNDTPVPTVLIVDDEEVTRMMIRRVLVGYGYEVLEAFNGAAALDLCQQRTVDLVLMDVRMPVMNGFDACRGLRAQSRSAHVPVLMLTSLDDVMAVTLAFEAGATDFITKPINWTLLAQRVRYALRTHAIERDLRDSRQVLASAVKIARLGRWRLDLASGRLDCPPAFGDLPGLPLADPTTLRGLRQLLGRDDRRELLRFGRRLRRGQAERDIEVRVHLPGQPSRHFAITGSVEADDHGRPRVLTGVAQDVTARRTAEARLSYQAHFDEVTALPNRVLFRDRVDTAMAGARKGGRKLAVLSIDIDVLHKAQATLTQQGADRMLKAVAARLRSVAKERDTLCRIDGNTFALLLTDLVEERHAAGVATRLMAAFAQPLSVGDRELLLSVNAGIAVFPGDGADVDTLLLRAGTAKARAHQLAGPGFHFYTADMQERVQAQYTTEVALYRGLERGEFELHYQPKVELRSGRIVGVEALLRWNRPGHGLQQPDSFISLLEQTGLIMDTGDWVLREACTALRHLPLTLAVNMSPRQFRHPRLADRLARTLEDVGFPPERLELEITEQIVMDDENGAIDMLQGLRARGVRLALDDYGTGFSSLQRLKKMPLHTLKIDKTFVTQLVANHDDAAIVRSTIELCHQLGIVVVAEGVEDDGAMRLLQAYGCDQVQGYGICRPLSLQALTEWLDAPGRVGGPATH